MHRFGPLAALAAVLCTPAFPRQDPVICGTHPEKWKEELFLHRQSARTRAASLLKSGRLRVQAPSAARDIGHIAVLEDRDGVVARRNDFNLDLRTVAFAPAAAGAARYRFEVREGGYDEAAAAAGTLLAGLRDDDSERVALPFAFPFFGATHRELYVNSDGNLTFTAADDSSSERSLGRLVAGAPRIAPLFSDLDPSTSLQGVRVLAEAGRIVVSWVRVPEYEDFGGGEMQTFQARLYPDGRIEFAYAGIESKGAVVGISPGGGQGSSSVVSFLSGSTSEYSSTVAERFSGGEPELDTATAAKKFYETHEDAYDYLVFFNNMDIKAGTTAVSWEMTVRNNQTGYGERTVDIGREYGSAARLQAIINMGQLTQFPKEANGPVWARQPTLDTPLTVIAHEAGHRFLAFASVRDAKDPHARPMLGFQGAHWNFAFNSEASLLEGNRIQDNGPEASPRFLTTGNVERFSALDQYLMGLRAPEEVEPEQAMFLATGVPLSFARRFPQTGVSFDGQRRDIPLRELIEAEGRRTPDHTVAQRHFRLAFILIVREGTEPSADQLAQLEAFRTGFEAFFHEATSNRAWADTTLGRSLSLSTYPAAGVIQGPQPATATASVRVATAPEAPLAVRLEARAGVASVPPEVTIAAGARSATFEITPLRAGVEEIAAIPEDARYLRAYSRVQVSPSATLRLEVISGGNQPAAPGAVLTEPVVVRVTDQNRLPYPGARVEAAASGGGAVNPAFTLTDESGHASFQWTPGGAAVNQLRLSLEGGGETGVATVQAGSGVVSAWAAVNAASAAAGLSPGSLATVRGSNLAGGLRQEAAFPWPETIGGVRVLLGGRPAPLLFVSDDQVNFYVPADVVDGTVELTVSNPRGTSAALRVPVAPVVPGVFFDGTSGFGAVVVSGTWESTLTRPARRGDYLEIYGTGFGPLRSAGTAGLQQTVLAPRVSIGGVQAEVLYSGLTPGLLGLYQVNVRVAESVPPGTQLLSVTVGGMRSNEVKVRIE
jgi:uncharacterized protein (TIGR03437 family)